MTTLLYRMAAGLFVVFAFGHTLGFLTFRPPTQEAQAVLEAMNRVHFSAAGRSFSYGEWYRGFGLTITASLLFWAFLSYLLGNMAHAASPQVAALAWGFFAVQLAGMAMAILYFGPPAVALGAVVTALVGAGAWTMTR